MRPSGPPPFVGRRDQHAFARLSWAAELFRNGDDYGPVEMVGAVPDALNGMTRLVVIAHRPTALALAHVVGELTRVGHARLAEQVDALCTAVNVAGSTLLYDVIAPDELPGQQVLRGWIDEAETAPGRALGPSAGWPGLRSRPAEVR